DEFGIKVPERVLQEIGTYGDLVDAIQRLEEERRLAEADAQTGREPVFVWVRIVPPPRHANGDLLRGGWLTPYTTETIVQDAVRSGPRSRPQESVPTNVSDAGLAALAGATCSTGSLCPPPTGTAVRAAASSAGTIALNVRRPVGSSATSPASATSSRNAPGSSPPVVRRTSSPSPRRRASRCRSA